MSKQRRLVILAIALAVVAVLLLVGNSLLNSSSAQTELQKLIAYQRESLRIIDVAAKTDPSFEIESLLAKANSFVSSDLNQMESSYQEHFGKLEISAQQIAVAADPTAQKEIEAAKVNNRLEEEIEAELKEHLERSLDQATKTNKLVTDQDLKEILNTMIANNRQLLEQI